MSNLSQLHLLRSISALSLCLTILYAPASQVDADEIVIDNSQPLATGVVVAPLVTIRPVTTTSAGVALTKTQITKDLIFRSATAFPEILARLKELGIRDAATQMSTAELVAAIKTSDYPAKYLYRAATPVTLSGQNPSITSRYAQAGARVWDAKTLTNMVVTGVVNIDAAMTSNVDGNMVQWYKIDDKYAQSIDNIYRNLLFLKNVSTPTDARVVFAAIKDDVTQYDALQRSFLENIGEITFGTPVVYTAKEKNLIIPESIRRSHDVYWIDLVVTYRVPDPKDLVEMAFNVAVPEQSVALKLIPLRFGVEMNRSVKEGVPETSIEYGGTKVSFGEVFSDTVVYTFLKPTIEAYGEGERKFSWKMSGEAVSAGSHRFVAILEVPRGTKNVDFAFSGDVRLRKSFIGEWFDGDVIAGTDSWVVPVNF